MALKPIKTALEIISDDAISRVYETCQVCMKEKDIPIVRSQRVCDDCLIAEYEHIELEKKKYEDSKIVQFQRIPERYKDFDCSKLEISQKDFADYCKKGVSLSISGEVGTGKTNLACQVLIKRRCGQFYSALEGVTKIDFDKLQELPLLVLDDLTKLDCTSPKRLERIFELFNYRYREQKDTIITLDRPYDEVERLFGDYGKPLVSRFRQSMFGVILTQKWR